MTPGTPDRTYSSSAADTPFSEHGKRFYYFGSAENKTKFDADPAAYVKVAKKVEKKAEKKAEPAKKAEPTKAEPAPAPAPAPAPK